MKNFILACLGTVLTFIGLRLIMFCFGIMVSVLGIIAPIECAKRLNKTKWELE